jgi:hypothetical protein
MYNRLLRDESFIETLYKIDMDLAQQYRLSPCPFCGEKVHFANYSRKIRDNINEKYSVRFSLCCSACRRRVSVPSTIHFGRFVYSGCRETTECLMA